MPRYFKGTNSAAFEASGICHASVDRHPNKDQLFKGGHDCNTYLEGGTIISKSDGITRKIISSKELEEPTADQLRQIAAVMSVKETKSASQHLTKPIVQDGQSDAIKDKALNLSSPEFKPEPRKFRYRRRDRDGNQQ